MNKNYILYLEDDKIDAIRFTSTLNYLKFDKSIVVKENGEEGLEWLNENKHWLPNFIVLDLNMPVMNGIEFLSILKKNENFKKIPVIVFSTSNHKSDINATYNYNIAGYMVKPFKMEDYTNILQVIKDYWGKSYVAHIS